MKRASLFAASVGLIAAGLFLYGQGGGGFSPPGYAPPFVSSQNAGTDSICALAKDSSLFLDGSLKTVTVTPGTDVLLPASGTWTTTGGGGTGASGTFTASGGNLVSVTIAADGSGYTSNPTWVPSSGTKGTSAIAFSGCANSANATSETAFATSVTIPSGTLSALGAGTIPFRLAGLYVSGTGEPSLVLKIRLTNVSGTTIYTSGTLAFASASYKATSYVCGLTFLGPAGSSVPEITSCPSTSFGGVFLANQLPVAGAVTVSIPTNAPMVLVFTATFGAATTGNAFSVYSISPN